MIEIIIEFVCSFLGDFLLQVVIEFLFEFGLHKLSRDPDQCKPVISFFGYAATGLIAGGLSLLVFPHPFAKRFHGISLIIAPTLAGLSMMGVGYIRRRRGEEVLRIDSFLYGFIFAFGMALIRYIFAR